jgi:hypothetical protein
MTVSVKETNGSIQVDIEGVIKGLGDSQSIKDAIEAIVDKEKSVSVNILDSFAITSSVIGYFRKKVQVDKMKLNIFVKDDRLYELFEELNLVSALRVKKLEN